MLRANEEEGIPPVYARSRPACAVGRGEPFPWRGQPLAHLRAEAVKRGEPCSLVELCAARRPLGAVRRLIGRSGLCLAGSALLAEACIEKWAGRESSTVRFASDATHLKGHLARRAPVAAVPQAKRSSQRDTVSLQVL